MGFLDVIALRAWEKPGNDGWGRRVLLSARQGRWMRCDAMRCDVLPCKAQDQGRSGLCQGVYFYKTRRLVWSCCCCSDAPKSQCRDVVVHLAVKIRVPL